MCSRARVAGSQRGQASPEWIGLVLLAALLIAAALAVLGPLPLASSLARTIASRIVCAVKLSDSCGRDPVLVAAYGADLAAVVRRHAPGIAYERGMRALPVDYRRCRSPACSDTTSTPVVWRSRVGEFATAFVHVVDCRPARPAAFAGRNGSEDCSGERRGHLYLQYWLYYADSATLRGVPVAGKRGYHRDDWEGYQVRIGVDGDAEARASSHHGYNYEQGRANWGSDAGIGPLRSATEAVGLREARGWGPETGILFVSGGSHAGNAKANSLRFSHFTPRGRLALIPLEPVAVGEELAPTFAVSPPWRKQVWRDPEAEGTG